MTALSALWLPILLSAVFVFVVSSLIHMVLPWHKNDFSTLPQEDKIRAALRPFATPPGDYMVPRVPAEEMRSPEFKAKLAEGPVQILTVLPNGPFAVGQSMLRWFVYLVVITFLTACVACTVLSAGTPYRVVFHQVGAVSFLAYAGGLWPQTIWYKKNWVVTLKSTIDSLVYALVTAGTFGWLWPHL